MVSRLKAEVVMKDCILEAHRLVEWLSMEDGPMGINNNNIWDWDGNNDK